MRKNKRQLMEMYGNDEAAVLKIIQLKTETKQWQFDINLPGDLSQAQYKVLDSMVETNEDVFKAEQGMNFSGELSQAEATELMWASQIASCLHVCSAFSGFGCLCDAHCLQLRADGAAVFRQGLGGEGFWAPCFADQLMLDQH